MDGVIPQWISNRSLAAADGVAGIPPGLGCAAVVGIESAAGNYKIANLRIAMPLRSASPISLHLEPPSTLRRNLPSIRNGTAGRQRDGRDKPKIVVVELPACSVGQRYAGNVRQFGLAFF